MLEALGDLKESCRGIKSWFLPSPHSQLSTPTGRGQPWEVHGPEDLLEGPLGGGLSKQAGRTPAQSWWKPLWEPGLKTWGQLCTRAGRSLPVKDMQNSHPTGTGTAIQPLQGVRSEQSFPGDFTVSQDVTHV